MFLAGVIRCSRAFFNEKVMKGMILLHRDSLLWEEKEGSPWTRHANMEFRKALNKAFGRFRLLPCMLELLVGKLKVAAEVFATRSICDQ